MFVQKIVGTDFENAHKIRTDYLQQYGTTLAGLMAKHSVNPDEFFDFIHCSKFLTYPKFSKQKYDLLMSLKGARYIFTNGRKDWSIKGCKKMGIYNCFSDFFDLKWLNWIGKPCERAYIKVENFLQSDKIILLDDSIKNLEPANKRGWITVLVNSKEKTPDWVNFKISHLLYLSNILPQIYALQGINSCSL